MKIGFDVDNVLNNMSEVLIDILNNIYQCNVLYNLETYSLKEAYPLLTTEQIFNPLTLSSFWDKLKVNEEGLKVIKELQEKGHEIYLITAQVSEGFGYKYEWMLKNLNIVPSKNFIFCQDKSLINIDALIDDHIDNLINFNGLKILYFKDYHKNNDIPLNIKTINSLSEVLDFI